MTNGALEDIKKFAIDRLTREYGYCGAAEGATVVMLNSGGDGENITINIKIEKDDG